MWTKNNRDGGCFCTSFLKLVAGGYHLFQAALLRGLCLTYYFPPIQIFHGQFHLLSYYYYYFFKITF